MPKHRTHRGQVIDFEKMIAQHGNTVAAGNMRVNANGDVLGPRGEIVQKNEERVRAYYKDNPRSSTSQSIKEPVTGKLEPDTINTKAVSETSKTIQEEKRVAAAKKKQAEEAARKKLEAELKKNLDHELEENKDKAPNSKEDAYEEIIDEDGNIEVIRYGEQNDKSD